MNWFLRTAMLLPLFLAGCGAPTDPEGRATAEWVYSKGGTVTVHGIDRELKSAADLPEGELAIVGINLNETNVTDAELAKLSSLRHLRTLGLHRTQITDAGLDALLPIQSLEELELSYTGVTDAGLTKLAELPRIKKLFLYGTRVTDDGVESFLGRHEEATVYR